MKSFKNYSYHSTTPLEKIIGNIAVTDEVKAISLLFELIFQCIVQSAYKQTAIDVMKKVEF